MIGICSIIAPEPGADPLKYLGRAIEHYPRSSGRIGRMLATRVAMVAAAFQAASGR
jgi:hypothetical protein